MSHRVVLLHEGPEGVEAAGLAVGEPEEGEHVHLEVVGAAGWESALPAAPQALNGVGVEGAVGGVHVLLGVVNPAVGVAEVRLPVGTPPVPVDSGAVVDVGLDDGPEHPLGPLVVRAGHHEGLAGLPHHPPKHSLHSPLPWVAFPKLHIDAHRLVDLADVLLVVAA